MGALSPQTKTEAYDMLKDALLKGLEKEDLSDYDVTRSARYINTHLEAVATPKQLVFFLKDLTDTWKTYGQVYVHFKQKDVASADQTKMTEIQNKLKQLIVN